MTYDELVADVKRYANTDDDESFNPAIPGMIKFAEDRIAKELDIIAEVANQVSVAPIAVGQRFITLPPSAKGVYQFRVARALTDPWIHLQLRSRSWCDDFAPDRTVTGMPRYYCIYNENTVMVAPAMAHAYYGELTHQVYITGLGPSKQTTWISDNASELLFEAVMSKVAEFQKHPERIAAHEGRYKEILSSEQYQGVLRMRDTLRLM